MQNDDSAAALTAIGTAPDQPPSVLVAALESTAQTLATLRDAAHLKACTERDAADLDAKHPADGPMRLTPATRADLLKQAERARAAQATETQKAADRAARHISAILDAALEHAATLPSEAEVVRARQQAVGENEFLSEDIRRERAQQNNIEHMLARQLAATERAEAQAFIANATGREIAQRYITATEAQDREFIRLVETEMATRGSVRARLASGETDGGIAVSERLKHAIAERRAARLSQADRDVMARFTAVTSRLHRASGDPVRLLSTLAPRTRRSA